MSICYQSPVQQTSTGEAGAKVNRDLEVLFQTLNNVIACQAKMADAFNDVTGGAFGTGGGTAVNAGGLASGATGSGAGSANLMMSPMLQLLDQGDDYELEGNFAGLVVINATDDITITFGAPLAGAAVQILNVSATSKTVTVKNDAAVTIGVITAAAMSSFLGYPDDSGVATWVAGAILIGTMGDLMVSGSIYLTTVGAGVHVRSPDGSYHEVTVSDAGTIGSGGSAGPPN